MGGGAWKELQKRQKSLVFLLYISLFPCCTVYCTYATPLYELQPTDSRNTQIKKDARKKFSSTFQVKKKKVRETNPILWNVSIWRMEMKPVSPCPCFSSPFAQLGRICMVGWEERGAPSRPFFRSEGLREGIGRSLSHAGSAMERAGGILRCPVPCYYLVLPEVQ